MPQAVADALRADAGAKRQHVVVVASLLDRAPNLAGLTRTCEVFLAERLVMADLRIVKDHEFLGISVTAEQHVPMEVRSTASSALLLTCTGSPSRLH